MSACDCSYPGHPKFLAAVVVLDNPIIGMMVRGRVAGSSPLVVVSGGVVMRRVQSIAKVVGDVAVLSHRVFHLVDGLKRRTSKTAKSEIVLSDPRPVEPLYITTHLGGPRSPGAGYMALSVANAAASASA